jgi:predicted acetyltransferase
VASATLLRMAVIIREPLEADVPAMYRADGTAFGSHWKPEDVERTRPTIELDRFRIAVDGDDVVGTAGSFGLAMTMPGGRTLPTGGVTWVSCSVTHRRQGVLSSLMQAIHADIDSRDEPLAALGASEGAIYERFGYGVATMRRGIEIDRRRAQLRPEYQPPRGAVRLVHPDEAVALFMPRWDRARLERPGEVDRNEAWMRMLVSEVTATATFAVHDDGFAMWKTEPQWHMGHPAHEVWVHDLAAATPDAHAALWHTLLSLDLTGPIRSLVVPLDDPLPYLLTDRRALRTTVVNDGLWLNVRDVRRCFEARAYGTDDDMVVESGDNRWRIGAGGCSRVRSRADLQTDHASLSALLLGGVRPSALVAGRRMTARTVDALRRADALFATSPEPYCQTMF